MNIFDIPAFTDNYIWAIQIDDSITIVDPGESIPVLKVIEEKKLNLQDILITHHHYDHTGGLLELKKYISGKVYGPKNENIDGIDIALVESDLIETLGHEFRIIETPGHTLDHLAFYNMQANVLFCGDTLFSAGCGRLFEGTYDQLHGSIQKINQLPDETKIYCGHEYTLSNLEFVKSQINSEFIKEKYKETVKKRSMNKITLPSTLSSERKINPFLLETVPDDIQDLKAVDCFKELRIRKDNF
ncbi:MAG: hydroxyacylglutathione hydrolase [Amoebophilaceae bacterium TMED152]|nr:hydroxyacylglutathione hydrolase [Gammaproteobacteria bacterium]RPH02194.1 MAG: hydroxyacylglutathione hydrolase [Amoebophilaceae bacterium TMED152]|tara:strand:- start:10172 stop:10903 length:732 start_codon:yes stop_codon:yes gene_type:complete